MLVDWEERAEERKWDAAVLWNEMFSRKKALTIQEVYLRMKRRELEQIQLARVDERLNANQE